MAISATIFKVALNIADMDRHYYQPHELTVAMHPSENNHRLMVRLLAFALNASEHLTFTKGLNTDDEPELWCKSLSDEIELWVDFGQVDEKRIRKACGRAREVRIYTYDAKKSREWWKQHKLALSRYANLSVFHIQAEGCEELTSRKMSLQCTIDEDSLLLSNDEQSVNVTVQRLENSE